MSVLDVLDYRASVARGARRQDHGDQPHLCDLCETERDVELVVHRHGCPRATDDTPADPDTDLEPAAPAVRKANGFQFVPADAQAWADQQPLTSRCRCGWEFTGPAGDARTAARQHRADQHPELAVQPTQADAKAKAQQQAAARAHTPTDQACPAEGDDRNPSPHRSSGGSGAPRPDGVQVGGTRYTANDRDALLDAIRRFHQEHGRPPSALEWQKPARARGGYPSLSVVTRAFGTWADAIEQAGFPRPSRATRYSQPQQVSGSAGVADQGVSGSAGVGAGEDTATSSYRAVSLPEHQPDPEALHRLAATLAAAALELSVVLVRVADELQEHAR